MWVIEPLKQGTLKQEFECFVVANLSCNFQVEPVVDNKENNMDSVPPPTPTQEKPKQTKRVRKPKVEFSPDTTSKRGKGSKVTPQQTHVQSFGGGPVDDGEMAYITTKAHRRLYANTNNNSKKRKRSNSEDQGFFQRLPALLKSSQKFL